MGQRAVQEPAKPDAFPLAFDARRGSCHRSSRPLPIRGSPCGAGGCAFLSARRQCSYRLAVRGSGCILAIALVLACGERRAWRKAICSSRIASITGGLNVLRGHIGQPEQIIGAARAHPTAGRGMPPVQHIAGVELVPRRKQDLLARQVRRACAAMPSHPATGRESQRRRSTGRPPNAPRCGRKASDTAASD